MEFDNIIDSFINGQYGQMWEQIGDFGWNEFTICLQNSELLEDTNKLRLLSIAIRKQFPADSHNLRNAI